MLSAITSVYDEIRSADGNDRETMQNVGKRIAEYKKKLAKLKQGRKTKEE